MVVLEPRFRNERGAVLQLRPWAARPGARIGVELRARGRRVDARGKIIADGRRVDERVEPAVRELLGERDAEFVERPVTADVPLLGDQRRRRAEVADDFRV